MIRVMLVDDSLIAITILKRMLSQSPDIEVVGSAGNGREALTLIPKVKPDVICTDLHMPVMDGLQFTEKVMTGNPLPILIVSLSCREGSLNAFKAIEAGAVDIFLKPGGSYGPDHDKLAADLIMKIRILSKVHVFKRNKHDTETGNGVPDIKIKTAQTLPESPIRIILLGASTGGPHALQAILSCLPSDFPLPIICIQHISGGFLKGLVDWLAGQCKMKIEIAKAGTFPRPGTVYFPTEDTHLIIGRSGSFVISTEPPLNGHRPSITVTMNAAAAYYGNTALGVLLTGMGDDGAEGLLAIKKAGGITIVQDAASSIVFGMPKKAIDLDAARHIAPLNEIGSIILKFGLQLSKRKNKT